MENRPGTIKCVLSHEKYYCLKCKHKNKCLSFLGPTMWDMLAVNIHTQKIKNILYRKLKLHKIDMWLKKGNDNGK